jgi:hypothetical protein
VSQNVIAFEALNAGLALPQPLKRLAEALIS